MVNGMELFHALTIMKGNLYRNLCTNWCSADIRKVTLNTLYIILTKSFLFLSGVNWMSDPCTNGEEQGGVQGDQAGEPVLGEVWAGDGVTSGLGPVRQGQVWPKIWLVTSFEMSRSGWEGRWSRLLLPCIKECDKTVPDIQHGTVDCQMMRDSAMQCRLRCHLAIRD